MDSWSVVYGEQPTAAKWNILGTNDATLDARTNSGWCEVTDTWTYVNAHAFTVAGDKTTTFKPGLRIRLKQGGSYKHFIVRIQSTYSGGNTTVTVDDGITAGTTTLANSAITDKYISYHQKPQNFPYNASFLDKVRVSVPNNSTGSPSSTNFPNNTYTIVGWTNENLDTGDIFDGGSDNTKITVKKPAQYLVHANVSWTGTAAGGGRAIKIMVNGTGVAYVELPAVASSSIDQHIQITELLSLSAGDYVQISVLQNSGGALTIDTAANYSRFELVQLP